MTPDWSILEINLDPQNAKQLLQNWSWLVPDRYVPFSMTAFGDWFLEGPGGKVYLLDLVAGNLKQIMASKAEFYATRGTQENLDEWYMAELAYLCYERGIRPGRGQCLGYKIPPVLNGELVPENIEVTNVIIHQSIMAQIHRGVKDLPEGTRINRFTVGGEEP